MPEETTLTQAAEPEGTQQPGVETPQAVTEPAGETQPGAETEPQTPAKSAPAKTYSEDEVRKITSTSQAEAAQARQYMAQLAMQQQIGQLQAAEEAARVKDRADVDRGIITDTEARERAQTRYQHLVTQAQTAQGQAMLRQQEAQGEQLGRLIMAQDMAKEYGVSTDDLLKDRGTTTPMAMMKKASDLALKVAREQARMAGATLENFDRGPGASAGKTMSTDHAMDRYIAGEITAEQAKAAGVKFS